MAIPADVGTGESRAELIMRRSCGDRYPQGVPVYYAWSVLVPTDYPYDGSQAFQIIGQFHHRDYGGSPAVAVHLALVGGEIRVDGVDVLPEPLAAANAIDPNPKVMKVGLYRGPGVTTDNVMYVDDIRVGSSWDAVGAGP